ncbi:hypothetical protein [Fusibacter sp. 3D3]|uniref:hypothetical protein n=1 Tax=Fusibacter sp. 3D3 TaxID=1048380 RepID=UPI000853E2D0|nr:hypothetical protein [Fusibacter sp. 3D3]GAU78274.1 hypothetical protein F3D3_2906 [Fusibacter sp. 3D3]
MKKIRILALAFAVVFTTIMPSFAFENSLSLTVNGKTEVNFEEADENNGIETRSSKSRYYYTETEYSYHTSTIIDEEDMKAAVKMAAKELEIGFYLLGGGLTKSALKVTASTLTKKKGYALIAKKLGLAMFVSDVAFATSNVAPYISFDAIKISVDKKKKIKWEENLANGRVTKMNEWITYKTKTWRRADPNSAWTSAGTQYKTFLVR